MLFFTLYHFYQLASIDQTFTVLIFYCFTLLQISLDGLSGSSDPDAGTDKSNLKFTWFCAEASEDIIGLIASPDALVVDVPVGGECESR